MKKISIALMLVCVSAGTFAAGCAKPRNAFDQVYCAGNLFSQADRDLNQTYTSLRKHLTSAQQATLKQGQLGCAPARVA